MTIIIFYIVFEVYFRSPFGTDFGPLWEPILDHFGLPFSIIKFMEKTMAPFPRNLVEFGGIWWTLVEFGRIWRVGGGGGGL